MHLKRKNDKIKHRKLKEVANIGLDSHILDYPKHYRPFRKTGLDFLFSCCPWFFLFF